MDSYLKLLLANQAWVQEKLRIRSDYFSTSAQGQKPEFLWIGCSDSRVPAEDLTGCGPGELFVHRNIANQVIPTDVSALAVLQYGITVLKVRHVIVCGHYNCGGAAHAMKEGSGSPVEDWLQQLRTIRRSHEAELEQIKDDAARLDRMVDISTVAQVQNLANLPVVRDTWAQGTFLQLHAWVYDLRTGLLKDLEKISAPAPV
jgi:carbonic anhydrase